MDIEDLAEVYWKYFQIIDADTDDLRLTTYRLRYQVYCVEHPFEPPNSDNVETDEFDSRAERSILIHRPTNIPAGTVRMVLPCTENIDRCFAIQEVCTDPSVRDGGRFPIEKTGEISRFCVPKNFRRRVQDTLIDLPGNTEFSEAEWQRVIPNMTLGLIEWLVRFSRERGLTHWCAVMEPQLLRLLTRLGIHFEPLGEVVQYHGQRQPCFTELEPMLRRVRAERPDIWGVIALPSQDRA